MTDAIYNQHPKFTVNEEEQVKIVDGIRKRKDNDENIFRSLCLMCKKSGFVIIRHNVVWDTIIEILQEVCKMSVLSPNCFR